MNLSQVDIIQKLTIEIMIAGEELSAEEAHPGNDSDRMDDRIAFFRERVSVLRSHREALENVFMKAVP